MGSGRIRWSKTNARLLIVAEAIAREGRFRPVFVLHRRSLEAKVCYDLIGKPNMKFMPGPGLGAHCIPVDPLYLSWKLKTLNYNARFRGSTILVLGVAYKKDVSDLRESPALDILLLLQEKGAHIAYHDPHVPAFQHDGLEMASVPALEAALAEADCVVVAADHSDYDWQQVGQQAKLLVDTRRVVHPSTASCAQKQSD